MSANRMFLVCAAHAQPEEAMCIATRRDADSQYTIGRCRCLGQCGCAAREQQRQREWFKKHAECGVDAFKLAFQRPPGWDVSPPAADTPAGAVRLALVNGSGDH